MKDWKERQLNLDLDEQDDLRAAKGMVSAVLISTVIYVVIFLWWRS